MQKPNVIETSTELNNSSESVYKLNNELKLDELILQLTEKSAELSLTHSLTLCLSPLKQKTEQIDYRSAVH